MASFPITDNTKEQTPEEFTHVEDWTAEDFEDLEDEEEDEDCQQRGGCMPDPEDFDD